MKDEHIEKWEYLKAFGPVSVNPLKSQLCRGGRRDLQHLIFISRASCSNLGLPKYLFLYVTKSAIPPPTKIKTVTV